VKKGPVHENRGAKHPGNDCSSDLLSVEQLGDEGSQEDMGLRRPQGGYLVFSWRKHHCWRKGRPMRQKKDASI